MPAQEKLVSISKAAKILGVSIDTVRRWDKAGILHSTRSDGKNRRFSIKELEARKLSEPLSIGEASKQLNISASTLRRLDKKGLIKPKRGSAGERLYDKKSLEKFLPQTAKLERQGINPAQIKPYHGPTLADDAALVDIEIEQEIASSVSFTRKILKLAGGVLAGYALLVSVFTALFFLYPETTSAYFGYRKPIVVVKSNVLAAETSNNQSVNGSVLGVILKPVSAASLIIVEAISPTTYEKVVPTQTIEANLGSPGANGKDGVNGVDGLQGLTGAQGIAGLNGTNGIDGVDGTSITLPDQSGNNGKVLSTNGSDLSWITNSSSVAWGAITGTFSNQTDLQTALNAKVSISSLGTAAFTAATDYATAASVAGLSGTNSGDNAVNSNYSSDYRAANFIAGTNYLAPNGSAAALTSFPTLNQNTTGTANNITGVLGATSFPAQTGDVTNIQGSLSNAIASGAVTLAKMANLAANSIIGNNTGISATPIALTTAQVKTLLAIANTDVSGLGTMSTQNANGVAITGGTLSDLSGLTLTSGTLTMSGLNASSISTGANGLTFTSSNFNTTATGINGTAIGTTTPSTGAFTTLSSTGTSNIGQGTGVVTINSSGALNLTGASASTWTLANVADSLNFDSNTFSLDALNNRVGIGTAAPSYKLSVVGNTSTGNIADITNLNTTSVNTNSVLRLSTGVAGNTNQARFIQFYAGATTDSNGSTAGHINLNNNAVQYTTAGADFAEWTDVAESVNTGDIIASTPNGNLKALPGNSLLGVVSDTAGFVGNDTGIETGRYIVGMSGRVNTKVSTENGNIAVGDPISPSSVAGVGMKQTKVGPTIGKALVAYSSVGVGRIAIQIMPGLYDPDPILTSSAFSVNGSGEILGQGSTVITRVGGYQGLITKDATISGTLAINGDAFSDLTGAGLSVASGALTVSGLTTSNFASGNISQFTNNSGYLTGSDLGTAAFTASSAYATSAQGTLATNALPSASFTDVAVTGKLLTGYISGAGTVAATDTILQTIQKLNGNEVLDYDASNFVAGTNYLTPNGSAASLTNFPTLNQNTTGTASNITGVLGATSFPALTGDITTTQGSLATTIGAGKVTNTNLVNSALTVTAGTGLTGGGSIALGSSGTLNIDSTVATLTGIQTLTNKTISTATNTISGLTVSNFTSPNVSQFTNNSGYITGLAWGSITGTLSNQTDLQTALNAKANSASLGTISTQNANAVAITGGTVAGLTGLGIRSTGTGAFDLIINNTENLTAGRTLTITTGNVARALTLTGDASITGTNTGDNSANSTYVSDFRAANFVAGTNYLAPNGSAAALTSFPTLNQNTTGIAANITGVLGATSFPAMTGDVTNTQGSLSNAITSGAVTLAKMSNLAANSIIGNNTGISATPIALTTAQVKTLLAIANTDVSGLGTMSTQNTNAVAITSLTMTLGSDATGDLFYRGSGGSVTKLADVATGSCLISGGVGTAPSWGSCGASAGTVTSVDTAAANNGVTATWATTTTTPRLTIGLGAITPTSITVSGASTINGGITTTSGTGLTFSTGGTGDAITIGGSGQTGTITLGSSSGAQNVIIAGGAGASVVTQANVQTGGSYSVGNAMTSGTISIGGGSAVRTGNITIGSTGQTSGVTIIRGGTGTGAFGGSTSGIDIIPGVAGTINIGASGGAGTGAITIGQSTATQIINIGSGVTGAGNTKTINIGAAQNASTGITAINIGLNNTSTGINTITLKAGGSGASRGVAMTLGPGTTAAAVCSSLAIATAPTAGTAYQINDCASAPVLDYAEFYPVEDSADYGDIMMIGTKVVGEYANDGHGTIFKDQPKWEVRQLVKANTPYANNIVGVISNNYYDFTSTGADLIDKADNPKPVALNGRVPVKIATDSEPIKAGDYLTTSSTPGRAMKATHSGTVLGKAMSDWNPNSGKDQIIVFIEQGYNNGLVDENGNSFANNIASLFSTDSTVKTKQIEPQSLNLDVLGMLNAHSGLTVTGISEFISSAIFRDIVTFESTPIFNKDMAGFAVIRTGDSEVDINFDKEYLAVPVVVVSPDQSIVYSVSEQTTHGFKINLGSPAIIDTQFNWIALAVKDARTVLSVSTVAPTGTPSATPEAIVEPSPTPTSTPIQTLTILSSELGFVRLRDIPSVDGVELDQIPTGTVLTYTNINSDWYQVEFNGKVGWVSGTYVQI